MRLIILLLLLFALNVMNTYMYGALARGQPLNFDRFACSFYVLISFSCFRAV